jgi:predicted DNA-binding transcriptional regulator YafY
MPRPTARVLTLLEILQSGGTRTVADLAARLDVDERTLRRYVEHLRDLDVPVHTVRGRYGGYRLAPGFRMPPLMFTDEEALAVLLGLVTGTRTGLVAATAAASDSATAKLRRVLPDALAERCDALLATTDFTGPDRAGTPPEARVLLLLAEAARNRQPVAITYADRVGRATERVLHPYGIVAHSGRWYVTGSDSSSGAIRTFRLDRISAPTLRPGSFEVPDDFDAAAQVTSGIARTPWRHEVSVLVQDSPQHIRTRFPVGIAALHELAADDGAGWVRIELRAERLDWIAPLLASLDRPFVLERPAELGDILRAFADRLSGWASAPSPASA